ncbi:MAG: DDE-type integrase/transposase/recombinase, partial [Chloroflexota bacterium]
MDLSSARKALCDRGVRDWETRFAPLITEQLRARRRGKAGRSWYSDETYLKVGGKWCYLYRAIDRDGNLVDSMLSEKRDMDAAKRFFKGAKDVVGHKPVRVTTDGYDSYPRAIRRILGRKVVHLRLAVRKFFCSNPACTQRIFTERLVGFLTSYARCT